jgi:hypothetical protein
MTQNFDALPNPPVQGLGQQEREYLAYELTVVGRAARERAALLRLGGPGVELAVVELDEFANRVLTRAHRYQPAPTHGGRR